MSSAFDDFIGNMNSLDDLPEAPQDHDYDDYDDEDEGGASHLALNGTGPLMTAYDDPSSEAFSDMEDSMWTEWREELRGREHLEDDIAEIFSLMASPIERDDFEGQMTSLENDSSELLAIEIRERIIRRLYRRMFQNISNEHVDMMVKLILQTGLVAYRQLLQKGHGDE